MSSPARTLTAAKGKSKAETAGAAAPQFSGQRPFGGHGSLVQTKLRVGPPGDRYEREADRVAESVMRMPEPAVQRKPT